MGKIIPIILSGGIGSRLWPLSTKEHPKAFIKLDDEVSLLQATLTRILSFEPLEEIAIVTHQDMYLSVKEECRGFGDKVRNFTFILEPCGRNSAAAIALACHYIRQNYDQDQLALVLPIDHRIDDEAAYFYALEEATVLAKQDRLVTFAAVPTSVKTGYGYIKAKDNRVEEFIEKPDFDRAKKIVDAGSHYWNCGMFCFSVETMVQELSAICPKLCKQTEKAIMRSQVQSSPRQRSLTVAHKDFSPIEEISIDHAIFEKSNKVGVVMTDMGWSDIGTWIDFGNVKPMDMAANRITGETYLEDVNDCVIHAENKLIVGLGLENLVIADTDDALLIADKQRSQDLKQMVENMELEGGKQKKSLSKCYRPWGNYTILQQASNFKIKRIEVNSGAKLSLQKHQFRSEHWVVVQGMAQVQKHNETVRLSVNQSIYIPPNVKHRLENHQDEPLILIEVQCGSYLGEDDIIRFDDVYGRKNEIPN